MAHDSHPLTLSTEDLFPLGARLFEPSGSSWANVVVLGATAVPQSFYGRFASHLAGRGVRTLTFDYRGIGASRPGSLRGLEATMTDWGTRDAVTALQWMKDNYPHTPVITVGHSFGGQSLGLTEKLHPVQGAIFIAAQFGYYGHWPLRARMRLGLLWHAALPVLSHSLGYLPGWAGLKEDLPKQVALEWGRWCRHPEYMMGHVPGARERFAQFQVPSTLYSFTDDDYAPYHAVEAFASALKASPLVHQRLAPEQLGARAIGHFGFFRPQRERLWDDALEHMRGFVEGPARQGAVVNV